MTAFGIVVIVICGLSLIFNVLHSAAEEDPSIFLVYGLPLVLAIICCALNL